MKDTIAVVVTYNRASLLEECIEALLSSSCPTDVLVVDNASTDNTIEVIDKYKDRIYYCNTGANLGGAGGFNIGLRKAYELGYKYFWLMDDDTIVKSDSFEKIMSCVEILDNDWGFISSKAVWIDGNRCLMNYHSIDKSWEKDVRLFGDGIIRIKTATFVSFFVRREVVADVGLPVKEYFIWGDDTEYSTRISQKYPSYYCDKSVVVHKMKHNQSTSAIADIKELDRVKRMELSIRNDMCTYRRLKGWIWEIALILYYLKQLIMIIIKKDIEYRFIKVKVIIKGILKGLLFHPGIERL